MEKINYSVEIVRDFNSVYYANIMKNGVDVVYEDLPEYVDYRTLRAAMKKVLGLDIPLSALKWEKFGRKSYGYYNN